MALAAKGAAAAGSEVDVFEATTGASGIRMAWRHRPDLVLADEITSTAGAFALAKDLKGASPPFPGAVVIFLERPEDEWLARWSGADAWFVKPVDHFALVASIRRLLGSPRFPERAAG